LENINSRLLIWYYVCVPFNVDVILLPLDTEDKLNFFFKQNYF
jgi:hypothetical protein